MARAARTGNVVIEGNDFSAVNNDDSSERVDPISDPAGDSVQGNGNGTSNEIIIPGEIDREFDGTPGEPASEQPKKRGRKPGTKTGKKRTTANLSTAITSIFYSTHYFYARYIKDNLWKLDAVEAKALGDAVDAVLAQYSIALTDKQKAWSDLVAAFGGVYGGRVTIAVMMQDRTKEPVADEGITLAGLLTGNIPALQ